MNPTQAKLLELVMGSRRIAKALVSWVVPDRSWLFVAALGLTVIIASTIGFSYGADVRQCAVGPSPEEATMRAFHEMCERGGGVYRWRFDLDELSLDAVCIGGNTPAAAKAAEEMTQ